MLSSFVLDLVYFFITATRKLSAWGFLLWFCCFIAAPFLSQSTNPIKQRIYALLHASAQLITTCVFFLFYFFYLFDFNMIKPKGRQAGFFDIHFVHLVPFLWMILFTTDPPNPVSKYTIGQYFIPLYVLNNFLWAMIFINNDITTVKTFGLTLDMQWPYEFMHWLTVSDWFYMTFFAGVLVHFAVVFIDQSKLIRKFFFDY